MRRVLLPLMLLAAGCAAPGIERHRTTAANGDGPRILCVTAHPDDEIAFAGTVYKTATHLRGACDLFVITNGEAGYKYSTLAESIYSAALTDPAVGRALLPDIRAGELQAACRILGFRDLLLLREQDHRYTLDHLEVLGPDAGVWNLPRIRKALDATLRRGRYDFVLTHLPVADTHGHHKAASILALEAIERLAPAERPVALGAWSSGRDGEATSPPEQLDGYPVTRIRPGIGPFVFDREQKFGFRDRLDYQIVVAWAIAEHKSQGMFQQLAGRRGQESFWLYALDVPDAEARARRLFDRLAEPQFAALHYDDDGNLAAPAAATMSQL